eukprot:scaffold82538_cov60-Phaeocystis_antarctica.AAC.4
MHRLAPRLDPHGQAESVEGVSGAQQRSHRTHASEGWQHDHALHLHGVQRAPRHRSGELTLGLGRAVR